MAMALLPLLAACPLAHDVAGAHHGVGNKGAAVESAGGDDQALQGLLGEILYGCRVCDAMTDHPPHERSELADVAVTAGGRDGVRHAGLCRLLVELNAIG